jgi:hypothetical protein
LTICLKIDIENTLTQSAFPMGCKRVDKTHGQTKGQRKQGTSDRERILGGHRRGAKEDP